MNFILEYTKEIIDWVHKVDVCPKSFRLEIKEGNTLYFDSIKKGWLNDTYNYWKDRDDAKNVVMNENSIEYDRQEYTYIDMKELRTVNTLDEMIALYKEFNCSEIKYDSDENIWKIVSYT